MQTTTAFPVALLCCAAISTVGWASQRPLRWMDSSQYVPGKSALADPGAPPDLAPPSTGIGDCDDYVDLSGLPLPITQAGTTAGASNDYGPFPSRPACWQLYWGSASAQARDKTYKWTVPADGRYTISLLGSSYDTSLLLYDFTCPAEPHYPEDFICGNDDAGELPQSELYCLSLSAGQQLLIVVDGYGSSSGPFQLRISEYEPAPNLETFILASMNTLHIPGLSARAVYDGRVIWSGDYGHMDIANDRAPTDSSLFYLASISKTFVGVALMQLWEQGFFELDDDINAYLPWAVHNPYYPTSPITFRMLMTHSSGISDNWNVLNLLLAWNEDSPTPLEEFLRNYLTPGGTYYYSANFVNAIPGTTCKYSNVGAALAAYLVEIINPDARSFSEYCLQAIFAPLGMDDTAWLLADLDVENIAVPYSWNGSTFVPYGHCGVPYYPPVQLRTSASQLARHLIAFMQHGRIDGTRILDSTTVDLMTTVLTQDPGAGVSNGLFWRMMPWGGRDLWGHGGQWLGCETAMFYNSAEKTGAIVLTNGESLYGKLLVTNELLEYAARYALAQELSEETPVREQRWLFASHRGPSGSATTIVYYVPATSKIRVDVLNVLGQRVSTLFEGIQEDGFHSVRWDAAGCASGIYFARLQSRGVSQSCKLLLVR